MRVITRRLIGAGLAGGLLAGCAEAPAPTCDALGARLALGESVADPELGLACRCTAEGPVCGPWTGEPSDRGRLFDPLPPEDAGPGGDGGGTGGDGGGTGGGGAGGDQGRVDRGAADGGLADRGPDRGRPDASPADGQPPDLEPACPAEPPTGRCDVEDQHCAYGAPSRCCVPAPPFQRGCVCLAGRWECIDALEGCRVDPAVARCIQREEVCAAWGRIRADADVDADFRLQWDGDVGACEAGDIPEAWRIRALARLNDWRRMAELPPVVRTARRDGLAQACALAMHARGAWTHDLQPEDPCYSPQAAQGAAESLVANIGGPISVLHAYKLDPGPMNFAAVPHRLWMLSNRLAEVGIGSTDAATCMHVSQSGLASRRPFIPWPAPGPFPVDAVLDGAVGWTVQSDSINFNRATVEVLRDGLPVEVRPRVLQAQYGAAHGFAFQLPLGVQAQAGETWSVRFEGTREPVSFEVELVDCADPP